MRNIRVLLISLISFLISVICGYAAEELTITTYYPSPYGVYRVLRLYPSGDFAPETDCSAEGEGAMTYYKDPASPANAQLLCCTGDPLIWQSVGGAEAEPIKTDDFSTAGSYTFYVPPGISQINVTVWGAGGGGGKGGDSYLCALATCCDGRGAGGGGAGAYASGVINVTPGTLYNIIVGAGGAGGTPSSINGSAGGQSSFSNLIIARGGAGGGGTTCTHYTETPPSGGCSLGGGGSGGTASGGEINFAGGDGVSAVGREGGGGGSPAVSGISGVAKGALGGWGGSGLFACTGTYRVRGSSGSTGGSGYVVVQYLNPEAK